MTVSRQDIIVYAVLLVVVAAGGVVAAGAMAQPVAAAAMPMNNTTNGTDVPAPTAANNSSTGNNQTTNTTVPDNIRKQVAPTLRVVEINSWSNTNVTLTVETQLFEGETVYITEFNDDEYRVSEYDIEGETETQITHRLQLGETNKIYVGTATQGKAIYRDGGDDIFDRPSEWNDHPWTASAAITSLTLLFVWFYLKKKREETEEVESVYES